MTRNKHIGRNAKRNTFYLTAAEELAIDTIKALRRDRDDKRFTPSEIISDAIWKFAADVEHINRQEIEGRFPLPPTEEEPPSKIRQMPPPKKES